MLRIDKVQTVQGLTVYGDNDRPEVFYVLPNAPRLRIDDNGRPVFQFLKYKTPIDRPGGKKAGGFAILDAAFSVSPEKLAAVKADLQNTVNQNFASHGLGAAPPVTIGQITWSSGSVSVHVLDSGGALVEKIQAPASPSLYGDNVTAITVEFSQEGSTVAEAAFKLGTGTVQVIYDVKFWTALPEIDGSAWFNATEFYSFFQTIHVDYDIWGEESYQETLRERFSSSQSEGVTLTTGIGVDDNLKQQIRSQLQKNLEEIIKQKMLEQIKGVDPSQRGDRDDESVKRDFVTTKVESFTETYRENSATEWRIYPQGTLPNIVTLKGPDGQPLKWEDYGTDVDLNDPFFKTLRIDISAPVKWGDASPIHSVDVTIHYGKNESKTKSFHLDEKATSAVYEEYRDDDGNTWSWHCQVNYKDRATPYISPRKDETGDQLTVDAALTGVLEVALEPGNIMWDRVGSAQVTLRYEPEGSQPIENVLTLTKLNDNAMWAAYLLEPQSKPFSWKAQYTMTDGSTYVKDWAPSVASLIPVNSPFNATRTLTIRAAGNLETDIADISLDITYTDEANRYRVNKTVVLDKATAFTTWPIPVINATGGKVTYSGSIRRVNGAIDAIPLTTAESNTIMTGDVFTDLLSVQLSAALIDWTKVAVIEVLLHYDDSDKVKKSGDFLLQESTAAPGPWQVELADKRKTTYTWTVTYFMKDQTQKTVGPNTSDHTILLIPAP